MTIAKFGRITPAQMNMLRLIGYRLSRAEATLDIPESERMNNIMEARKALIQMTGQDFGYDLAAWHDFLSEHKDYGYTHPYAFKDVKKEVLKARNDTKRQPLISRIQSQEMP